MAWDYSKAYQTIIDEALCAESMTKWMEANEEALQYAGGKDAQICELQVAGGLGVYDTTKTDGGAYPSSVTVGNKWRSYSLFMDRAAEFAIPILESDTNFITTAENYIREIARTVVAPEMDTYRICKLYNTAVNGAYSDKNVFTGAITKENAVSEFIKTLAAVQTSSEQNSGYVAMVNHDLYTLFADVAATNRLVELGKTVTINGVTYEGAMLVAGVPCLFVPKERMLTDVLVLTGREDEAEGGIKKSDSGKYINFVVCLASAPLAVTKIKNIKQFSGEENQEFDGTLVQMRYLYDTFVTKNKVGGVAVHGEA